MERDVDATRAKPQLPKPQTPEIPSSRVLGVSGLGKEVGRTVRSLTPSALLSMPSNINYAVPQRVRDTFPLLPFCDYPCCSFRVLIVKTLNPQSPKSPKPSTPQPLNPPPPPLTPHSNFHLSSTTLSSLLPHSHLALQPGSRGDSTLKRLRNA